MNTTIVFEALNKISTDERWTSECKLVCDFLIEQHKELTSAIKTINYLCRDWADDDTRVKKLATPFLSEQELNGNEYGFHGVVEVVECLVAKLTSMELKLSAV